jgi:hypothetical protein
MKKLLSILLIGLVTFTYAQNESNKPRKNQFTTEQQAILQTKKMVLILDLNKLQESQLLSLNQNRVDYKGKMKLSHKEAKLNEEEPSTEQLFEMKIEMLDAEIRYQSEIKKILTEKQLDLWRDALREKYFAYNHKSKEKAMHKRKMKEKP